MKNKKQNNNNFFSWKWLYEKYPKYKNVVLNVVITERNAGKSYATYKDMDAKKIFTPKRKGLIFRNTDKELIQTKRDFANRYKGRLLVKGDFIYNIEIHEIEKDGENIKVQKTGEVVGYFASINNYINYKSIEAKDVIYIMYEEFNEDTVIARNIYFKFINILKTFERFNKLEKIIMLGNKDGFDSDFFVNWGIIPADDSRITKITEIKDDYGIIGVVFDMGANEFIGLNNSQTISNRLGSFDARTNNYMNMAGFLKEHSKRVINFKEILPTFKPEFYISIDENKYIFGEFEKGKAILSPWNFPETNLKLVNYSFDISSSLMRGAMILDNADHIDLIDFLFKNEKANNIFYDSYDSKMSYKNLLVTHKRFIQNN